MPEKSRWQLATIASNTGCVSVTEPLITRRISAVAVWRSSASLVSLNSRTFSMAISAWSAKDSASAISASRNGPGVARPNTSTPMHSPSRTIGTISDAVMPLAARMRRSLSGSSMAVQSGRWSIRPVANTRAGKLSAGSMATSPGLIPMGDPSRVAPATIDCRFPFRSTTTVRSHASSRTAVPTMASNTGCTLVGEPLITRRMSAVAVWFASASCVSLNSRAFSMAITAWSANVASSAICLSVRVPGLGGRHRDDADRRTVAHQRRRSDRAECQLLRMSARVGRCRGRTRVGILQRADTR